MGYSHWFVSRQKRQLTTILDVLVTFRDICVGEKWSGNTELQLRLEDELGKRNITQHGSLRSRKTKSGGGGIRTLITQLKDLGLIFLEDSTGKAELTLIGEAMANGEISFMQGMRLQLQRYQYPSATRIKGAGAISQNFKVHPFQFLIRLLLDADLNYYVSMDEMKKIVIHQAQSDSDTCYNQVKNMLLKYRDGTLPTTLIKEDTSTKTYENIANTFFNYITLTQFVDREYEVIQLRKSQISKAHEYVTGWKKFIANPEYSENYQRAFGRGLSAKDSRRFDQQKKLTSTEQENRRILKEFLVLKFETPIQKITTDVIDIINEKTGINKKNIEKYLVQKFPAGCLDDFFTHYRELAYGGQSQAIEFERATTEICEKIFGYHAKHIGQKGRFPDVFVRSDDSKYCGIFDNKAYPKGYSLTSSDQRAMISDYIPNYKDCDDTKGFPLAFFCYISTKFLGGINKQIENISSSVQKSGFSVRGAAIPVNCFIDIASDYTQKGYNHEDLKRLFSVNRELSIQDISDLRP